MKIVHSIIHVNHSAFAFLDHQLHDWTIAKYIGLSDDNDWFKVEKFIFWSSFLRRNPIFVLARLILSLFNTFLILLFSKLIFSDNLLLRDRLSHLNIRSRNRALNFSREFLLLSKFKLLVSLL